MAEAKIRHNNAELRFLIFRRVGDEGRFEILPSIRTYFTSKMSVTVFDFLQFNDLRSAISGWSRTFKPGAVQIRPLLADADDVVVAALTEIDEIAGSRLHHHRLVEAAVRRSQDLVGVADL